MTEPRDVPFDDLYACRTWVRALARRLVRDDATADDLEQQVWTTAVRTPPREGGSVRSWLGAVARNAARNLRRAAGRRDAHETAAMRPESDGGASSPDVLVAEAEAQQALVQAVLALDEPYRTTVLLRHFRGMETSAIAAQQGVPVETVRTRLKRAHEKLRATLDRRLGGRAAWSAAILVEGLRPPWGVPVPASQPGASGGASSGNRSGTAGTTTGTSPFGAGVGGAVMAGTIGKAVAAAVLVAGFALWWGLRDDDPSPRAATPPVPTETARAGTAAPASSPRPRAGRADPASPDLSGAAAAAADDVLPPPVDLDRVDRDLDLHGVVVDDKGKPVAGARIGTFTFPWRESGGLAHAHWYDEDDGPATRSAADGTFALRLSRAQAVEMRVAAPGFGRVVLPERLAGERVRVVLRPAVTLVVVARDGGGAPVPDVRLRVFTSGGSPDPRVHVNGVTGADGRATFDSLPPSVEVWIDPDCPLAALSWIQARLPATGTETKELTFTGGRTLRGRITDAATSAPVAGAEIGMNWVLGASVRSAADGTYELPGWTGKGVEDVHVLAPGFARAQTIVGDRETIDFALIRGFAVSGRVLLPDGTPAAGAIVAALAERYGATSEELSTGEARSGADGTFTIAGLSRALPHTLTASAAGGARVQSIVSAPAEGDAVAGDIRLPPPHRVEGIVADANDVPIARAAVTIGPVAAGTRFAGISTRTDDLGRFRFPAVAAGPAQVRVRPVGQPETGVDVVVPPEGDLLDVVVRLEVTREVRIRVVLEDGTAAAGVPIRASDRNGRPLQTRTDESGNAVLHAGGPVRVEALTWAWPSGDASVLGPEPAEVAADATEVVFTLRRGDVISGTVTGPDGRAVGGALVAFVDGSKSPPSTFADAAGAFRITVAKGARGAVVFHGDVYVGNASRWLPMAGRADVGESRTGITIRARALRTDLTLRVRVVGSDGRPCAGQMVLLTRSGADGAAMAKTGDDGVAAFRDLDERSAEISVPASERGALSAPVEVVPAGQEIVVQLARAALVAGTVVAADGTPAGAARVQIHFGDRFVATLVAGATDGRFAFHLPDDWQGPFRLRAVAAGTGPTGPSAPDAPSAELDGVVSGTTDVRLVLGE